MEDLIKGELDWHNKVNSNFHEVDSQMADIINFKTNMLTPIDLTNSLNGTPNENYQVLQNVFNSISDNGIILLPNKTIKVDTGLMISKNLVLKFIGSTQDGWGKPFNQSTGSISFDTIKSNMTLLTVNNNASITIENLTLEGLDGTKYERQNVDAKNVKDFYITFSGANCNGLDLSQAGACRIDNLTLKGFSGKALIVGMMQYVYNPSFVLCGASLLLLRTDSKIINPHAHYCKNAIQIGDSTHQANCSQILDARIEWIEEFGIQLVNGGQLKISGFIDRCGYSGFTSKNNGWSVSSDIDLQIGRCGAYYRNNIISELSDSDIKDAGNAYINSIVYSKVNIIETQSNFYDDTNNGTKNIPIVGISIKNEMNSIIKHCANMGELTPNFDSNKLTRYINSTKDIYFNSDGQQWILNDSVLPIYNSDNKPMAYDKFIGKTIIQQDSDFYSMRVCIKDLYGTTVWGVIQLITSGPSNKRPSINIIGYKYFDTTLNKPIYWNGTNWVDSTGTTV